MLNICLAVIFLHLIYMPIMLGINVDVDSGRRTAVFRVKFFGITAIKISPDYDKIAEKFRDALDGKKDKEPQKKSRFGKALKKYFIAVAKAFIGVIRVVYIGAECLLGFDDAAATAITSGSVLVALCNVCELFGCKSDIVVTPDYDNNNIDIHFDCIIMLNFADIIYAVFSAAFSGFTGSKLKKVKRSLYGNNIAK